MDILQEIKKETAVVLSLIISQTNFDDDEQISRWLADVLTIANDELERDIDDAQRLNEGLEASVSIIEKITSADGNTEDIDSKIAESIRDAKEIIVKNGVENFKIRDAFALLAEAWELARDIRKGRKALRKEPRKARREARRQARKSN